MTNETDPRLQIIESNAHELVLELCGVRITVWQGERDLISIETSKALHEYIRITPGKTSIEWTKDNEDMQLTFLETQRAVKVAHAVKTIGAFCARR